MDATVLAAIDRCIRYRIPFIAYALPNETDVIFYANASSASDNATIAASVSFFGPDGHRIPIYAELTANDILRKDITRHPDPEIIPYDHSTTREEHRTAVERIVERLRRDGGKTVLSRTISGQRSSDDWSPVIETVFDTSLFAFRFIYYTRATGCWFGASPELLGKIDTSNRFTTMALAGTRTHGEPWDCKNREEHQLVIDYIADMLTSVGLKPEIGDEETVSCGPVEHLRHIISARMTDDHRIPFTDIIRKLSPTPALAGYPLETALHDIEQNETHSRHCYGGYIALHLPDGSEQAYVNLRSCHFHDRNYCIYAGGGITAQSNPATEWDETEAKASTLLKSIIG